MMDPSVKVNNKKNIIKRRLVEINVKCEWKDCQSASLSKYEHYKHIGDHVRDLEIGVDEFKEGIYIVFNIIF